ncbi:hypothetical protein N9N67_04405 [Bacteriovoracaceae bacterium]|nr:hypothetical protein [Bacteriovoracaceae bacterium]
MKRKKLGIHSLGKFYSSEVWVEYELKNDQKFSFSFFIPQCDFQIRPDQLSLAFNKKTFKGNWGLWEKRPVLEVFLQKRTNSDDHQVPYIEFQISPEEEYFLATVHKIRQVYSSFLDFSVKSAIEEKDDEYLKVSVEMDLSCFEGEMGDWYGNFYMILPSHEPGEPSIYAGVQLDQKKLDFHLPRIFKRL